MVLIKVCFLEMKGDRLIDDDRTLDRWTTGLSRPVWVTPGLQSFKQASFSALRRWDLLRARRAAAFPLSYGPLLKRKGSEA